MKRVMLLLTMAALVVACEPDKPATDSAPSSTAAAEAKMSDEQLDTADIPVEEDFEDDAVAAITPDTLDDQLDALEKEIEGDL